jgi:hypothetical protein
MCKSVAVRANAPEMGAEMSNKTLWYVAAAGFLVAAIATATTSQWILAGGLAAVALLSLVVAVRAGKQDGNHRP